MRKIIELAALRSKRVELAGEVFVCMEPPASESMTFSETLKTNRVGAFAYLFRNFVKTEDGSPAFTEEESRQLAAGSAQVFMPLFLAITGFADSEKKASTPTPSSDTVSPSPSDAPSKN